MSERAPPRLRRDGDARRQAILDAAIELFAEHGFEGASARAITSHAGANLAAIKYYFGDKIGLYHAALQAAHAHVTAAAPSAEQLGDVEPQAALQAWLAARLRAASHARTSEHPAARLLLRAATEVAAGEDVSGLEAMAARLSAGMREEVEHLLARWVPTATPAAIHTAAGYFLLIGTRFAESSPELDRFDLRPPSDPLHFEQFVADLWRFLRAGLLELLSPSEPPSEPIV